MDEKMKNVLSSNIGNYGNKNLTIQENGLRFYGRYEIIINKKTKPTEKDPEILKDILSNLHIRPEMVKKGMIGDLYSSWLPVVKDFLEKNCFEYFVHEFHLYRLQREEFKAINLVGGNEYVFDNLRKEDVEHIQKHHGVEMKDEYITRSVELLPSSCIRLGKNKKPIAWILTYLSNRSFGFLYVLEEFRGKGFAKRVLQDIIQKSLECSVPIPFIAHIKDDNEACKRVFETFGFTPEKEKRYIICYSSKEFWGEYSGRTKK